MSGGKPDTDILDRLIDEATAVIAPENSTAVLKADSDRVMRTAAMSQLAQLHRDRRGLEPMPARLRQRIIADGERTVAKRDSGR